MKNGVGSIGLIAVNEKTRSKGIGSKLIAAADAFYHANGIGQSTVITQASNIQACRFYEKAGFQVIKKEYVYHWWLK
jgi:ribosomal protein S18 acetylase RimI-like enzyme